MVKLIGTFVYTEIFAVYFKRMFEFSAVLMGTERSGMCVLAEAGIDHMLLPLQTFKVVQLHALLVQTNPSWVQGISESSCLFYCAVLLLYTTFGVWEKPLAQSSVFGVEERATNTSAEESTSVSLETENHVMDRGEGSCTGSDSGSGQAL